MSASTKIYRTKNFDMFRSLTGNRPVKRARFNKVRDGIKAVGQIVPVIVNEKYEVIDGQARIAACKSLDIPVMYIIEPGIGIDECMNTNSTSTIWNSQNYIDGYSNNGNLDYKYLDLLIKRFKALGSRDVVSAVVGKYAGIKHVKDGKLKCDETRYIEATNVLSFEESLLNVLSSVGGRVDVYKQVLGFCFVHPKVDNAKLFSQISKHRIYLVPVSTTAQALDVIENIYNRNSRERIYISTEYKRMIDKDMTWYEYRDYINQGETS